MEEQIKKTSARVRMFYVCFWLFPIVLVLCGEMGDGWTGLYAGAVRPTYVAESVTILLTACCVPVSLKLFSWMLERRIDVVTFPEALRLYSRWSGVRLLLLFIPVAAGLFLYYLMWSSTGMLCALIGLTASLFCLPGEERLRKELHIDKEDESNRF